MARLALILIDPFADWEPALLAASAKDDFGDELRFLTPGGRAVRSMGGLSANADGAAETFDPEDADALVLIGSPTWQTPQTPDFTALLQRAAAAGIVVAGICGATLALARAGLLDERAHTSNGLDYLQHHLGGSYRGAAHYRNGPRAVADGKLVTAGGLAPASFASEVLKLLHPQAEREILASEALFAREHRALPETGNITA